MAAVRDYTSAPVGHRIDLLLLVDSDQAGTQGIEGKQRSNEVIALESEKMVLRTPIGQSGEALLLEVRSGTVIEHEVIHADHHFAQWTYCLCMLQIAQLLVGR